MNYKGQHEQYMKDRRAVTWAAVVLATILSILIMLAFLAGCLPSGDKPEVRDVRERICTDSNCDSFLFNAADMTFFNDDHKTPVVIIDGDGSMLISAPTSVGTATPAFMVDCAGVSNCFEIRDAQTPVWSVADGGAISQTGGDLTVTGNTTLGDAADDTLTVSGDVLITGIPDSDTNNYNRWVEITGDATGVNNKDRNFGLTIDMTRPAGQEITTGDHLEAALKISFNTKAVTTTAGTTMRAIDAEAKADNPSGTASNVYGASITAKSDTGAGSVVNMIAATFHANNNAAVTSHLMAADFNLYRQAATEPSEEYGIQVRSTSSTGSGADAAIYVNSEFAGSATTDSFDYALDISGAAINTADIRLENGETISNQTDTAVQIGAFLALTEGAVVDLANGATITPVASYQPMTAAGAENSTTDASTAIANGVVPGQLLILCNEDATYNIIIKDGANTILSGDITLTAGNYDCLAVMWNGADWFGLFDIDN